MIFIRLTFNNSLFLAGLAPVMFVLDNSGVLGLVAQWIGISYDMEAGERLHQTCVSEMTVANRHLHRQARQHCQPTPSIAAH